MLGVASRLFSGTFGDVCDGEATYPDDKHELKMRLLIKPDEI